jgi:hypothetical protein
MYQYLTKTRSVSPAGIIILRNEDATRERILENIQAIQNADIPRDTPILIFWAGYGSRARAAPNSTQHVQILLPHDFDPKAKNRKDQGIPDYMFDRLLSEVARLKGDNVVSVFLVIRYVGLPHLHRNVDRHFGCLSRWVVSSVDHRIPSPRL